LNLPGLFLFFTKWEFQVRALGPRIVRAWTTDTRDKEEPHMRRALFATLFLSLILLTASCGKSTITAANKPLGITITYTPTTPEQFEIAVDDGVHITKNQDTIKWKVKYVSPGPGKATVMIDDFRFGSEKNPFGNGSQDKNQFKFEPDPGGTDEKDTEKASKPGDFKYKITITLPDGRVLIVDPVVISDN